jgi:hypothetical protein
MPMMLVKAAGEVEVSGVVAMRGLHRKVDERSLFCIHSACSEIRKTRKTLI